MIRRVFSRPYAYWVFLIAAVYFSLNVLLSGFYRSAVYIPYYLGSVKWVELLLSLFFSVSISFLVGANVVLAYLMHKKRQSASGTCAVSGVGVVGGFATGVCSACLGTVPFIFSIVGVSFTWTALPFSGLEVQAAVLALLAAGFVLLGRR